MLLALALFFPTVTARIDSSHVLNTFTPELAFGAGIDGQEEGDAERSFLPVNVKAMRGAGLRSLTYRLRTELGCEAFHWNPEGSWSNPAATCGYWTSSPTSSKPIERCFGYRLPRRGNTIDQANNDGFSRLDDGDLSTYWKSNPYLDPKYTGEPGGQWIVIDLGKRKRFDTLIVHWAEPYATRYRVEYWKGEDSQSFGADGAWLPACPEVVKIHPGADSVGLADVRARYIKILLLESSHTAMPSANPDPRDALGFAIREIELGSKRGGEFKDEILHRADRRQTVFYTSSTDPWHRAGDLDRKVEQPGFDRVIQSGLDNGLPMLVPAPCLYDTPDNAANEIAFLKSRGVKLKGIELGEEPDGQCASARDYAALYSQFALAIRKADADAPLGGPSFQSVDEDYVAWPEPAAKASWLQRVYEALAARGEQGLFQFVSFEWYPFDDVDQDVETQILQIPSLVRRALRRLRQGPLETLPFYITECGYSAFAAPQEDDLPGAILDLDTIGSFLAQGGATAYLYGYEVNSPISEKDGLWGNLMMVESDEKGRAKYRLPTYYGAKMLEDWCGGPSSSCSLVRIELDGPDSRYLSAHAVRDSSGEVALLVLNRSASKSFDLDATENGRAWQRESVVQYSPRDFRWLEKGEDSRPAFSNPPERFKVSGAVSLPPYSISVVRCPNKPTPRPGERQARYEPARGSSGLTSNH